MTFQLDSREISLAAVAREMPCAAIGVDGDDRIVLWNPASERLTGFDSASALGRNWRRLLGVKCDDERVVSLRHQDGREIPVESQLAPTLAVPGGQVFFLRPQEPIVESAKRVVQDVLQLLPAYFSIIDTDQRYRMVCRSCEVLFGRSRPEIEGRPVREMFGATTFAKFEPLLQRALAGEPAHGEFEAIGADGGLHHLRVHLQPIGSPRPEAVFGFAYDVTELRETEATLRKSETQLKYLIEKNPDLICLVDSDNRLCFINHTEPDPTTTPEELHNLNVIDLSPPEYRGEMLRNYATVRATGQPLDVEAPIVWRGQTRWFESRLVALPESDRPPGKILIVAREVTRRILIEQALRESETRFRQFAEALEDVVWIHDIDPERVTFVNASFERVWGVSRETLYADPHVWANAIATDERSRVKALWDAVMRGETECFNAEYRIVRPDGGSRWIHDYGVVIRDESGRPLRLTGLARDISARKAAQEEKEAFQRQLQETQKLESLGVLAGGIAHDFNNLLSGILANINLAQRDAIEGPAARARLDEIESIALRAGDLCKQMLAYAGKGRFVVAPLDINALIDESEQLFRVSVSKKVQLTIRKSTDLPKSLADASQIRQVLLNLVINASEAFGDGVGAIRISTGQTHVSTEDLAAFLRAADVSAGDYVYIEVADNGPGMSAEVAERIFEPFFTTKFTGRGLGLAAVLGIMRSHHGAVRVETQMGQGTAFTVLLPPLRHAEPTVDSGPPAAGAPLHSQGEALVVDDEEIIRSALSLMLKSFGFSVVTARDGREAVRIFQERHSRLKLVLLDLTMPVLAGEEAHAQMAKIDPDVPVIFMSGYMEQELTERSNGRAIAGFLQKPFRMEALEAMIADVLGSRAAK
jgi:two-component system cell cycle sensor histidine kinase/response regulator CckA